MEDVDWMNGVRQEILKQLRGPHDVARHHYGIMWFLRTPIQHSRRLDDVDHAITHGKSALGIHSEGIKREGITEVASLQRL